jgi:tRNA G26 N,N-dimethylase Trm1
MASLSGNQPDACFAKYGSMPTHGKYLHEMALRIVLNSLESSACRYHRHIVPILSVGIDFYVRVFVRVFESAQEVGESLRGEGSESGPGKANMRSQSGLWFHGKSQRASLTN